MTRNTKLVDDQTWGAVRDKVQRQVRKKVWHEVDYEVEHEVENQMGEDHACGQIWRLLWDQVNEEAHD